MLKLIKNMKNPIIDNRIVNDYTFATRFLNFVKDVDVNDPCSEDEKESMIHYATKLLKYQCKTAEASSEIEYLIKTGSIKIFNTPDFITFDKININFDDNNITLYSCFKNPHVSEQCLEFRIRNINDINSKNKQRIFFYDKQECLNYIILNAPSISRQELADLNLLSEYNNAKNKL